MNIYESFLDDCDYRETTIDVEELQDLSQIKKKCD